MLFGGRVPSLKVSLIKFTGRVAGKFGFKFDRARAFIGCDMFFAIIDEFQF